MSTRSPLAVLLALAVTLPVAAPASGADQADASARKAPRLKAFRSCSGLVDFAQAQARRRQLFEAVPPPTGGPPLPGGGGGPGGGGPGGGSEQVLPQEDSAGPQPAPVAEDDSSRTNVQEQGVDEPDTVKTDGSRIFTLANDQLHAVDARAAEPKLLGSLKIEGGYPQEMLLHGERLLVVASADGPASAATSLALPYRPTTLLLEVDVSDPSAMRVLRTMTIEGGYVSGRLTGDDARLVISSQPDGPELGEDVDDTRLFDWLPTATVKYRTGRTARRALVRCGAVRRPRVFSGLDLLTVLTVDMSKGLPAIDSDALMTDGQTVYASKSSLYVATERWIAADELSAPLPPRSVTAIHSFDITKPGATSYRASGQVPGYLLNQWALSEHEGVLRAATTNLPQWWGGAPGGESESFVIALENRGGTLTEVGKVGGLGKGERIFAVRFIEDVAYVVTFRQTDPLYTVDVSDPANPKVLGELKIRGYSAYLHPVGDDLLLGVGQDATEQGRTLGTQLSLFDVSDLRNPRRLHQAAIGSSSSDVEWDHRAFLYWAPEQLVVVPVSIYGGRSSSEQFLGAIGFNVDRANGIREAGRASHEPDGDVAYVSRSLVVGGRLFTVSHRGVEAGSIKTLAEEAFVAFPSGG